MDNILQDDLKDKAIDDLGVINNSNIQSLLWNIIKEEITRWINMDLTIKRQSLIQIKAVWIPSQVDIGWLDV